MILNSFVELEENKFPVVIFGSGPAGLSLALELEKKNINCLVIEAGDEYYIFDIGDKSVSNLVNWRIPLGKIKAVFISHLHLDHYSDLEDLHLWGWVGADRKSKLEVYGGEGILKVLDGIEAAIQYDNQYRNEHHDDIFAPLNVAGFNGSTIDNFSEPVYENKDLKISAFLVDHHPI